MNGGAHHPAERISSLELDRGLYAVKYSGPITSAAPTAFIMPAQESAHLVRILAAPGAEGTAVWPGSVAIIHVEQRATIHIVVRALDANGSLEAKFELDHLDKSKIEPRLGGVARSGNQVASRFTAHNDSPVRDHLSVDIVGHVAKRGDVRVANGSWLAGPTDPAQIEGVALHTTALEYQVLSAGEGRWSDWGTQGAFVGTRGRYSPLVGIRVRLTGRAATEGSLKVSALFLGSSVVERAGREVELLSAAGVDPLIGLLIDVRPSQQRGVGPKPDIGTEVRSRVRVFRAGESAFI